MEGKNNKSLGEVSRGEKQKENKLQANGAVGKKEKNGVERRKR